MNTADIASTTAEFEAESSKGLTKWDIWVGLVPLLALTPMLFLQAQALWSRTHMQFFPLSIAGALFFAFEGWRGGESTHPVRRWAAMVCLAIATLVACFGVWKFSPWMCQLAAIMVFFGWALGRCGNTRWASIGAWTGLLLTTLPLPLNMDVLLIQWLQVNSSWACGKALDAIGIPFLRLANVIQIRGRELFVEEACSGIGSLYALMAVAVLLVILNRRSFFVALVSLLSVPLWAMVGNFVRLMSIVIAQENYGRDLSHGTDHEILGLGTFLLAAGCFWLTENFLGKMLQPVPIADAEFGLVFSAFNNVLRWPQIDPGEDIEPEDEDDRAMYLRMKEIAEARQWRFNPMVWTEQAWLVRGVVACGVLLLLAGLAPAWVVIRGGAAAVSFGLPSIAAGVLDQFPGEEALPEAAGELKRVGYHRELRSAASNFGEHSLVWEYLWQRDQMVALSLDFPFDSWHPLSVCYRNAGWTIEAQKVFDGDNTTSDGEAGDAESTSLDSPWPWEEMEMVNDLGGRGYVYFCAFTDDLAPFTEVPGALSARLSSNSGIIGAMTGRPTEVIKTTYQIQLYVESGVELNNSERRMLREQFLELRSELKQAAEPAIRAVGE